MDSFSEDVYFIFRAKLQTWQDEEMFPKLISDLPFYKYPDLLRGKSLGSFPALKFLLPQEVPYFDVLLTMLGKGIELYSLRFIRILENFNIPFEKSQVRIVNRNLDEVVDRQYYLVNFITVRHWEG